MTTKTLIEVEVPEGATQSMISVFNTWVFPAAPLPFRILDPAQAVPDEHVHDLAADVLSEIATEHVAFQSRVGEWLLACFGEKISADRIERNHRFLEESLELVQSLGCTADEAHKLVDYVYGRPVGEPTQEVGGVMVTIAALCRANGIDMQSAGENELARVWTKVEQIREKQKRKPSMSPLPGVYPEREAVTSPAPDEYEEVGYQYLVRSGFGNEFWHDKPHYNGSRCTATRTIYAKREPKC